MKPIEEESFPRGGKKRTKTLKRKRDDDNLFAVQQASKPKNQKKKRKPVENVTDDAFHSSLKLKRLSYQKVHDGMVILGCVRRITAFSIEVEFPGIIFGHIPVTYISDPFTKDLNKRLEENDEESDILLKKMFHVGQFVVVKVMKVKHNDKGIHLDCSVNPRDINIERSHTAFKKGILVWACVKSQLDHGYEMDLGIKNCRAFLPTKNVEEGVQFVVGQPLWCAVHKSETTNVATTLRLSSKHAKTTKTEEIDSLHDLIPGMQVEMLIEKITANGLHGKFLEDYFGYIDETQLKSVKKIPAEYSEGKLISGYVLYVDHTLKVTNMTMRNLDSVKPPEYSIGDVLTVEIFAKIDNGMYLKLPNGEKGFVTNNRLIKTLPGKDNEDINELIKNRFPLGSKHPCRILDYSHMSRLYICTLEQDIVKEQKFSIEDVRIGELLLVKIEDIKSEGLVVSSGRIKGFVPNVYLSNTLYSENLKKKYKEGQTLKARILNITKEGNVTFTLKPNQVENDNCLTSFEQAKEGGQYPGVVALLKPAGAMITFYGDVKGWLPRKLLLSDSNSEKPDPTSYFYVGQVVNTWVLSVNENRMLLSMEQHGEIKSFIDLDVGRIVSGIVGKVNEDGIDVTSKKGKLLGTVPVNHLSCGIDLCPTFLKRYQVGDEIDDLLCLSNKTQPNLLSRRECIVLKNKKMKLPKFENLRPKQLIRCSYVADCEFGIYVLPHVLDYSENILIKREDVVLDGDNLPKFKVHQSVVARILEINHEPRNIRLTIQLKNVFESDIEYTLDLFCRYLLDVKELKTYGKHHNWELCQYATGERIDCKVEKLAKQGGCLVTLPNGCQGLVPPNLCPAELKEGQIVKGVFLDIEFSHDYAEICLKNDVCQKINTVQDGVISGSKISSCISEILLIKTNYVLGVLKEVGNRQLIYIPLFLHENDFLGCKKYYENNKLKTCVCGKSQDLLIGMSKALFLAMERERTKFKPKLQKEGDKSTKKRTQAELNNHQLSKQKKVKKKTISNTTIKDGDENIKVNGDENTIEKKMSVNIPMDENEATSENDISSEDEAKFMYDIPNNLEKESNTGKEQKKENSANGFGVTNSSKRNVVLPGVSSFFNVKNESQKKDDTSSDEEEQTEVVKKKKKLTAAERAELAKQEEERISQIEKELADSKKIPESADQFDRLLLAKPNSSELWTRYMSLHIAATEFEKARTVAKRALQAINPTLIEERLNIWLALLNLENMFGTKESFEKTFQDAVSYNDSLTIYLKAIEMLAEAGKLADMEEKILKVRKKHKAEPKMWLELSKVYYQINEFKEARNLKEAALKSILDKKTQIEIIVRFAIMEFKYGEEEHGAAIFETILSSEPRKVNIWTTYVDQLIKKEKIDQARRVLERAVCQKLPLKAMKTLFLKFRMFEEQHGSAETVENVKQKAKEYVNSAIK